MSNSMLAVPQDWNQRVARLLRLPGDDALPGVLAQLLGTLVAVDELVLVLHRPGAPPATLYDNVRPSRRRHTLDAYLKGAYLLDPVYLCAMEGIAAGFYRLAELAPRGFRQTEYYTQYYRDCGSVDEVVFLVRLADGAVIDLSLARDAGAPVFAAREIARLRWAEPLLNELLQQHCRRTLAPNEPAPGRASLRSILENFGAGELSNRERQVAHLYLRGYSTRDIADKLFISPGTVALHRKHIYARLGISSQSALFHRFIASLERF